MHLRKSLVVLAAFLVGLGFIGGGDLHAASIKSVQITSPDSGSKVGIDSTFQVRVAVQDFSGQDSLEVVVYMATADSVVVADTTNVNFTFGAMSQVSVIRKGAKGSSSAAKTAVSRLSNDAGAALDNLDAATRLTRGVVAAQHKNKRTSGAAFIGDGDSLATISTSNDTTVFIWYGKVHASTNTISAAKAAAFAIDPSASSTTGVTLSTETLHLDGDRPANPGSFTDLAGNPTDNDASTIDAADITGEVTVENFNSVASNNHLVANIGDTLTTRVSLGGQRDAVLGSDSLKVVMEIFGKEHLVFQKGTIESPRTGDTLKFVDILTEGEYGNLDESWANSAVTDTLHYFIIDPAGNRSSLTSDDVVPMGVTAGTNMLFDTQIPKVDGQEADGDTLLPTSADTLSDGTRNTGIADDLNPITYHLADVLDSLVIELSGSSFAMVLQNEGNAGGNPEIDDDIMRAGTDFTVDFTQFGTAGASGTRDTVFVTGAGKTTPLRESANAGGGVTHTHASGADTIVTTGTYTVKFTPTDAAGNVGATVSRTDVYVDVDDIDLLRMFPTAAAGLDTLEENTASVIFQLSEPADSVTITYTGTAGTDKDSTRSYSLVGGQLTTTTTEQTFAVPGLVHSNQYTLQVIARDLAGNFTQTAIDTFQYDTSFAVPIIAKFTIGIADAQDGANPVLAGDDITLTITAKTAADAAAVTYGSTATLTIASKNGGANGGVKYVSGTGATDNGDGTITLNGDDWVIGARTVVIEDTTSVDTLTLSIVDASDATLLGSADSTVTVNPAAYHHLSADGPDTVGQGDNFWVDVKVADSFGNTRIADNRFVEVSTTSLGVQIPGSAVQISKGAGGFWANSASHSGSLVLTVRDIVSTSTPAGHVATGGDFFTVSDTIHVDGSGGSVLDPPNTVIAGDYLGASGDGDQGGFVILTFDASDDHSTLDGYRIYREISVNAGLDSTGALVALDAPSTADVPWGIADAVPGESVVRVVVATLDADSASYKVGAERGGLTTAKQAFSAAAGIANPYEQMASMMMKSKEAALHVPGTPVFAKLTPEALEFESKGVVTRMKAVDNMDRSHLTRSNATRAVDNIAPVAVPFVRALDTPADKGGSITVSWAKSADDRLLTSSAAQAVGGQVFTTAGVEGYNIYRKVGDNSAFQLVGQQGPGATSYVDHTVFNGVRYAYQVKPYDTDNITDTDITQTAMAIRNQVSDANGNPVFGLFGADNQVGFDDFFILADQIGMTAADEAFEPAFDISPNNKIDLDDFFTFADHFGRAIEGAGKSLPMLAGLNSDARFYLDAGTELPRVGEEMAIAVSLEDFAELKGYGLSVSFDSEALAYVGAKVENSILGTGEFAEGQMVTQKDGLLSLAAYGDVATEGDLGLSLVFRSLREIEDSYIEIVDGQVRDGSYGLNSVATPVSVRIQTRPEVYALRNNYPNPFNPETTIKYQLPEAGDVTLEVYNMLGQVVRTLVNQHQTAGRYAVQWDANNDNGQALSSGIYFYRVQVGGEFNDVRKMLLLK